MSSANLHLESRTWNLASHLDRFSGLEKDPGDNDGDGAVAGSGVLPPESTSSKDSQAPPKKWPAQGSASTVAKRPAASKKTHEVALEEPQRTEKDRVVGSV